MASQYHCGNKMGIWTDRSVGVMFIDSVEKQGVSFNLDWVYFLHGSTACIYHSAGFLNRGCQVIIQSSNCRFAGYNLLISI